MSRLEQVDLNDLLAFATVAEAGGFTAAADRLGRPKANVSLQIKRLEKALGGELKLDAAGTVQVRLGQWREMVWYVGSGIGASVRI